MTVQWVSPNSSNIQKFGYDAEKKELYVDFQNETRYAYFEVPESTFDEMSLADSAGKFFHANVRNNFNYIQVY